MLRTFVQSIENHYVKYRSTGIVVLYAPDNSIYFTLNRILACQTVDPFGRINGFVKSIENHYAKYRGTSIVVLYAPDNSIYFTLNKILACRTVDPFGRIERKNRMIQVMDLWILL